MQQKHKTPWLRYISIFLFVAVLVVGITNAYSRSRAQGIGVTFGGNEVSNGIPNLNDSVYDSKQIIQNNRNNRDCPEPGSACSVSTYLKDMWASHLVAITGDEKLSSDGTVVRESGLLSDMANMVAAVYTPQASGVLYVAELLDNTGLVPNTYAQGYGYYALSPYLQIWRLFRNVVYMLFAIIIIVISFMILFRQRVGNQAAVTAQQALPRIVVALILVTFSYAIAGFMVDLMYWIMYTMAAFVNVGGNIADKNELVNGGFWTLTNVLWIGRFGQIYHSVNAVVETLMEGMLGGGVFSKIIGSFAGIVATLIVAISMVFCLFRTLFILLKSYAMVLIYTMFSPFMLMMHAIPGTNSFSTWIKRLVANLAPFVLVFFMIIVVGTMNAYTESTVSNDGFIPPYIMDKSGTGAIGPLISLAIMLALPEIITNIKNKLAGPPGVMDQVGDQAIANFNRGRTSTAGRMATGVMTGIPLAAAGAAGRTIQAGWRGGRAYLNARDSFAKNNMIDSARKNVSQQEKDLKEINDDLGGRMEDTYRVDLANNLVGRLDEIKRRAGSDTIIRNRLLNELHEQYKDEISDDEWKNFVYEVNKGFDTGQRQQTLDSASTLANIITKRKYDDRRQVEQNLAYHKKILSGLKAERHQDAMRKARHANADFGLQMQSQLRHMSRGFGGRGAGSVFGSWANDIVAPAKANLPIVRTFARSQQMADILGNINQSWAQYIQNADAFGRSDQEVYANIDEWRKHLLYIHLGIGNDGVKVKKGGGGTP